MANPLYISESDTRKLVSIDDALRIVEQVCHWQSAGEEVTPDPRIYTLHVEPFSSTYRFKAAALTSVPVAGVRVTGFLSGPAGSGSGARDNTRFVILSDPSTARPLAIVDEHWTYNLRTCASGVTALKYLSNPEPRIAGLVGAGQLAATCAEMLASVFSLAEIRVTSRRPESREEFAARMTGKLGVYVVPKGSPQEVVEGADIIISCTSSREYLIHDGWMSEGAVLCALGPETHPSVFRSVDKVLVSDRDVVWESPDIKRILAAGQFSEEEIWADLPGVVTGRKPGREFPHERILIRASGIVSQDIAIAHYAYESALREGLGIPLGNGT